MSGLLPLVRHALCGVLVTAVGATLTALPAASAPVEPAPPEPAPRASAAQARAAGWTTLCTGYVACAEAGMPHAGYRSARSTMWWRMYAGHNCTNYAAYRMVRSGLPNVRPWTGGGNATHWGTSRDDLTDGVPAVGAVAWWRANAGPAGSAGHVAYVERVVSRDVVVVSQDSWGGDFSWARISRSSGAWPSGFVHFNDARLANRVRPRLSGRAKVGALVTATGGRWAPGAVTLRYRWRADGAVVPGATGRSLRLTRAQQRKRVTVQVTASRLGYRPVTVASGPTARVGPGRIRNVVAPRIAGAARVGSVLTASPGRWTPTVSTLRYGWRADGRLLRGATRPRLRVGPRLQGRRLTATVTAARPGYRAVAASTAGTAAVRPGVLTMLRPPSLRGVPRPGRVLRLDPGQVRPAPAAVSWTWWRDGVRVGRAGRTTYRLGVADLGSRVSVRVRATRPGYTTVGARTPALARVRSVPHLRLTARAAGTRVRLDATVTAAGVRPVTGVVRILWRGRTLGLRTLRGGAAMVTTRALPAGTRVLLVRYGGSTEVGGRAVRRTVRVG
jgi:surface antigen